jgi:hypothetical protein
MPLINFFFGFSIDNFLGLNDQVLCVAVNNVAQLFVRFLKEASNYTSEFFTDNNFDFNLFF